MGPHGSLKSPETINRNNNRNNNRNDNRNDDRNDTTGEHLRIEVQEVPGSEDGARDSRGDAELLQHQGTLHRRRPVPPRADAGLEVAQESVVDG